MTPTPSIVDPFADDLVSFTELARKLKVNPSTPHRWGHDPDDPLPAVKIGRGWFTTLSVARVYLARRSQRAREAVASNRPPAAPSKRPAGRSEDARQRAIADAEAQLIAAGIS